VLDGKVVSLGNPEREMFLSMLRNNLEQQIKEEAS
jgi:hypothetical protein